MAETATERRSLETSFGTRHGSRWRVFSLDVTRLVGLVMAGCLMTVAGCGSGDSESDSALGWARVDLDAQVFGEASGPLLSVTAGGPGLVAVGITQTDNAPVWTSPDGVDWTSVAYDEVAHGEKPGLESVATGGPGLVAVGQPFGGTAVVWTSADGSDWSKALVDDDAVADAGMTGVTSGGPGLVAVGYAMDHAAVWTSPDGVSWTRIAHDESIFGRDDTWMLAVTAGGPGLVAVGSKQGGPGPDYGSVWTSPDGITWSRVPRDEDVFADGTQILDVAPGGPGLVAVGTMGDDAAAWTSADGITWSRVPHSEEELGGEGDQAMMGVSEGGPGLVAVGSDGTNAAVWTSADGITWSRTPHDEDVFGGPDEQAMRSVTSGGPGLVAVGIDANAGAGSAIWIAED